MSIKGFARVWWLLAVLAGCSRAASPSVTAPSDSSGGPARRARFTLEVTPSLTGSRTAVLRSGDQVVTGDGIRIAIKASVDAHLYVGYCDRDRKLTIFPPVGSIEAKAGELIYAPAKDATITLDDQIGPEVLYVIGSRRKLDIADPELAATISKVRPGAADVECGESLDHVLESKRPVPATPEPAPAAAAPAPAPAPPAAPPPAGPSAEAGALVGARAVTAPRAKSKQPARAQPSGGHDDDRLPPPAKLERGGYITWGPRGEVSADGDRDEIVVLRYSFIHVAP